MVVVLPEGATAPFVVVAGVVSAVVVVVVAERNEINAS